MNDLQELVDMLEAGTRDMVVAAAVRWHAAYRHCQAVIDAADDCDGCDCLNDENEARIARSRAIQREQAENLAETVEVALRSGP